MKKNNKKGFTLAELLIVVAIIGVLVAISIPIFTSQLEKSREAVDLANIRAAYAECTAEAITGTEAGYSKKVEIKQSDKSGWITDASNVAGEDISTETLKDDMYVNVSSEGVFTFKDAMETEFVDIDASASTNQ
ncbi:MAG: type II secretion system protein [Solobacterium sp.]|nr:type II secretion system protein [Solobacterium sp.]